MKKNFIDKNIKITEDIYDTHILDQSNWFGEIPPFTNIELNICNVCNRKCFFCPKSDHTLFPNKKEYMSLKLYTQLLEELSSYSFKGRISLCGLSEPFLHKGLDQFVAITKKYCPQSYLDILTNGDFLTIENTQHLFNLGLDNLKISMYDGPEQIIKFRQLQKECNLSNTEFVIRERYLSKDDNFGLTINNRGGTVNLEEFNVVPLKEPLKRACYYPFHKIIIDVNGEVLVCPNDWQHSYCVGNIQHSSIIDIWNGEKFKKIRLKLINNNREGSPCNSCDVDGTLYAKLHFKAWKEYYAHQ